VSTPFTIDESVHEGQAYLALSGCVDLEVRRPIRDRVRHYLAISTVRGIIVDLASATFIDPNGLGILLACRRRAIDAHKTFRISAASDQVIDILAPSGILKLLEGTATAAYLALALGTCSDTTLK
jgi:anti-anti-sigma factor